MHNAHGVSGNFKDDQGESRNIRDEQGVLLALVAQCTGTGGAVCKGATPSVEQ